MSYQQAHLLCTTHKTITAYIRYRATFEVNSRRKNVVRNCVNNLVFQLEIKFEILRKTHTLLFDKKSNVFNECNQLSRR